LGGQSGAQIARTLSSGRKSISRLAPKAAWPRAIERKGIMTGSSAWGMFDTGVHPESPGEKFHPIHRYPGRPEARSELASIFRDGVVLRWNPSETPRGISLIAKDREGWILTPRSRAVRVTHSRQDREDYSACRLALRPRNPAIADGYKKEEVTDLKPARVGLSTVEGATGSLLIADID